MSAHWFWDWNWQRDRQGGGARQGAERDADTAATGPATLPAPTTNATLHPPHQPKDDVPLKKDLWKKPCWKECVFVQNGPNEPPETTRPDGDVHWEKFCLREIDAGGNPINDHAQDEWYWVRCKRRQGCCTKGVVKLKIRVLLAKQDDGGGPVYIEDFKCRCREDGE